MSRINFVYENLSMSSDDRLRLLNVLSQAFDTEKSFLEKMSSGFPEDSRQYTLEKMDTFKRLFCIFAEGGETQVER